MAGRGFRHSFQADINLIRDNLQDRYSDGFTIIKELLQNSDDAKARTIRMGVTSGIPESNHVLLRSPAVFVVNDGKFDESDERSIRAFGLSEKANQESTIGKFGLGLKSIFHWCEAFFYFSSRDGLPGNLLNPWSGDEDSLHPEWDEWNDEALKADRDLVFERLNNVLGGDRWFCLWIPLRQRSQYRLKEPIRQKDVGDEPNPAAVVFGDDLLESIAAAMPILSNLKQVEIWLQDDSRRLRLLQSLRLDELEARRLKDFEDAAPSRATFSGKVIVKNGEGELEFEAPYAGSEVLLDDDDLNRLRASDQWPKLHTIDAAGASVDKRDNAYQHAAAYLVRMPQDSAGSVSVSQSVFLPVGEPQENVACPGRFSYRLVLHGYYFVDAGRKEIEFSFDDDNDGQRKLRHEWNRILRDRGAMSRVLPALELFARRSDVRNDEAQAITEAVGASNLFTSQHRHICSDSQWVYGVSLSGNMWQLTRGATRILNIPTPPSSEPGRPWKVLPGLSRISDTSVITFTELPRLARPENNGSWADGVLAGVLKTVDASSVFQSEAQMSYLSEFITNIVGQPDEYPESGKVMAALIRSAIRSHGASQIRQFRRFVGPIISKLPRNLVFHADLGSDGSRVTDHVVDAWAEIDTDVLALPTYTIGDGGDDGENQLGLHDAVSLLTKLAEVVSNDHDFSPSLVTRLAYDVIQAVDLEQLDALRARCEDLQIFRTYRGRMRSDKLVSWAMLSEASDSGMLFSANLVNPASNTQRAQILQDALAELEIFVLYPLPSPRSLNDLLLPNVNVQQMVKQSCVQVLSRAPRLGSYESRAALLRDLTSLLSTSANVPLQTLLAFRYLLHGDQTHVQDVESNLFIESQEGTNSLWARLARQALRQQGQDWRVILPNFESLLSGDQRRVVGMVEPRQASVTRLIQQVGPESISFEEFSPDENDSIFREIPADDDDSRSFLRKLRMHEDVAGKLCAIGEHAYIEGNYTHEAFTDVVTIIKSRGGDLADKQRRLATSWGPALAIATAVRQDSPEQYWRAIMDAVMELEQNRNGLPDSTIALLQCTSWIPRRAGSPLSGSQVLHVDGMADEIAHTIQAARINDLADRGGLSLEVKEHPAFDHLVGKVFPKPAEVLRILADSLQDDSNNLIGEVAVSDISVSSFVTAFERSDRSVMPAAPLIAAALRQLGEQICIKHLLTPLAGPVTPVRLRDILNQVADAHANALPDQRNSIYELHLAYLNSIDIAAGPKPYEDIRLLNRVGEWKLAATLCHKVEAVDDEFLVSQDQGEILSAWSSDSPRPDAPRGSRMVAADVHSAQPASQVLQEYFAEWEGQCPDPHIGGILSLLGNRDGVKPLAERYLGDFSLDATRGEFGWQLNPRSRALGRLHNIEQAMDTVRFIVKIDRFEEGSEISVVNVIGESIEVPARSEGSLTDLISRDLRKLPYMGDNRYILPLREINPSNHDQSSLSGLLLNTARIIMHAYFQQGPGDIDSLWERLGKSDQFQVEVAQALLIEDAMSLIRQLGVSSHPKLRPIARKFDDARRFTVQAEDSTDDDESKQIKEARRRMREAKEELRRLLGFDLGIQAIFEKAVRQKVKDFQYRPQSVPFELFQNADDATSELQTMVTKGGANRAVRAEFRLRQDEGTLIAAHWGRAINQYRLGDFDGRDLGYAQDLEKMLILGASDKPASGDLALTGKFGLGFKSVFLLTHEPEVVSDKLALRIMGGVFPRRLAGDELQSILAEFKGIGVNDNRGTLYKLSLAPDLLDASSTVVAPFQKMAPLAVVFSKSIKDVTVQQGNNEVHAIWQEHPVALCEGIVTGVVTGPSGPMQLMVIKSREGSLVVRVGPRGFIEIPEQFPAVWITVPVASDFKTGFAVNANFQVDVGRSELPTDSRENRALATRLSRSLGHQLIQLFDACTRDREAIAGDLKLLQLQDSYDLWESLWDVLAKHRNDQNSDSPAEQIVSTVVFGDADAGLLALTSQRDALPTKLSGQYKTLTRLGQVQVRVSGVLDTDEKLFAKVSGWDSFRSRYPVGSAVSSSRIGNKLEWVTPSRFLVLDFVRVLSDRLAGRRENGGAQVSPADAAELGAVVTPKLLEDLRSDDALARQEGERIEKFLADVTFVARDGSPRKAENLLLQSPRGDHEEEAMRAIFAPDARVLSEEYQGPALNFFLACRPRFEATVEQMAGWVLNLRTNDKKIAALRYLLNGEQALELFLTLRDKWRNTWLADLESSLLLSGFSDQEKSDLLTRLGIRIVEFDNGGADDRYADPTEVLNTVYDWWQREGRSHLTRYEDNVYPGRSRPKWTSDLSEQSQRISWLRLFMLGTTYRMGGLQTQQHRSFLELMDERGWTDILASRTDRSDLSDRLSIVVDYFDELIGEAESYHWFANLVPILQVSLWLDAYVELFLGFAHRHSGFDLDQALASRADPAQQGGGISAPPLIKTLGIGACFVLRELVRAGVLGGGHLTPYCYVPTGGVRSFLEGELGLSFEGDNTRALQSKRIHDFLVEHLGSERATFDGAFDIPLRLLVTDTELMYRVLGHLRS